MGWITDIGIKIFSWLLNPFIERFKLKFVINDEESFTTTFKKENYTVIKIKLINNNDFDIKSLSFETEPKSTIVDNLKVPPSVDSYSSSVVIFGERKLIKDSYGDKPISVENRNSISGSLIFKTDEKLKYLIVNYQDKKIRVKLKGVENTKTFKTRR